MGMNETLIVNKEFFKGPPKRIINRKNPVLIRCADCDHQITSTTNMDWISDDGYTGLCYPCWDDYDLNDRATREYCNRIL